MVDSGSNFLETRKKIRRRRFYLKIFFLLGFLAFLVFGTAFAVARAPFLKFERIVVVPESEKISGEPMYSPRVSSEEIVAYLEAEVLPERTLARVLGSKHFFSWPDAFHESDFLFFPRVKRARVEKNYAERTLTLKLTEREPVGVWCAAKQSPERCFWFDEDGIAFEKSFSVQGNLIVAVNDYSAHAVELGARVLSPQLTPGLLSILRVIRESELGFSEVRLNDIALQEIEARVYEGPKIYFSLRFPSENALGVIQSLAEKPEFWKLSYIDFRVENRAYYK